METPATSSARPHGKIVAYFVEKNPAEWLGFLVKVFASIYVSRVLQSFTGTALWLPEEWRVGIAFASSLTFIAFSELMAFLVKNKFVKKKQKKLVPQEKVTEEVTSFVPSLVALIFLAVFVFCFWQSQTLRAASVWPFAPNQEWWGKQFGDAKTEAKGGKSTMELHLPDFLNEKSHIIYFPDKIDDPNLREYLVKVGKGDLRTGIRTTLNLEPIRLIDWADARGKDVRQVYNRKFVILHFCLILCFAGAWGALQKQGDFALETVLDLFHAK